ncbi:ABC transporter permease [Bosea psychrotolerans]|uniref:ABC-2 type transport system permease protein n=1 Tax=Bosea psychrotolerans TaxID=1871628 RepID=A0A2S4MGU3_9HYPH|nr:ABC transporter permease [Bosea psychrotolerans]POR53976.1 ABC-2 type transport system permease protein [Bosea psychrotolerans]
MIALFSPSRLGAMLAKEFVQMRRDRITFAMMLAVPIIQLLLFGYAINNDPRGLPAAILALGQDRYTRAVVSALEVSNYYRFGERPQSAAEAESLMAKGEISFLVTIPSDFGTRVERADAPRILVEADATDPAAASGAVSALGTIASRALQRAQGHEPVTDPASRGGDSLSFVVHRRYNPENITQYNIVPGLLGVILQMTMVMMTAMALTREIERGTMENLLAMPATAGEIMLGKVLPYLAIGAVQVVIVLGAAKLLFAVPFLGGLGLLLSCVLIFVLALVLLGYTISTMARTQLQAMQLTFFFFLPSLMLSGFMFPFAGMPGWAQALGEIFPLTHFLRIIRAIMLKGAGLGDIGDEMFYLSLFVPIYAGIALMRFRSTLD